MKSSIFLSLSMLGVLLFGAPRAFSQDVCHWQTLSEMTYSSSSTLEEIARLKQKRDGALSCLAKSMFQNFLLKNVRI